MTSPVDLLPGGHVTLCIAVMANSCVSTADLISIFTLEVFHVDD